MKYDVVVLGGGIAGFHAAVASARTGVKTLLIERNGTLGGVTTMGMVNPFMKYRLNEENLVQGIFKELNNRTKEKFGVYENTFDSELIKITMMEMIKESNADVLFHTYPIEIIKKENKIIKIKIRTSNGIDYQVESKVFIDSTGDGVLSYLAGAEYESGNIERENQAMTVILTIAGVDFNKIKEDVKNNKDNFLAWVNPNMEIISVGGYFQEIKKARKEGLEYPHNLFFYAQMPGKGRVTVNSMDLSHDAIDPFNISKSTIKGTINAWQIYSFAKKYVKGFENSYLEKVAPDIGIRESRRIKGLYKFTGDDVKNLKKFEDGVVKACYGIDVHKSKKDINQIDDEEKKYVPKYEGYYEIPLRSLISKDFENLGIAGKCFSSDFMGHSAARVQPTSAGMGQSIGVAAGIAIKSNRKLINIKKEEIINKIEEISIK